jgi:hypothetical protein
MNEIKLFNQLPTTKEKIQNFAQVVTEEIREGYIDPLQFRIYAKNVIKAFDAVMEATEDLSLTEAGKRKGEVYLGSLVEVMEAGTRYNYSGCNDPEWTRMNLEMLNLKALIGVREKILQGLRVPTDICDEEGTVTHTIFPPIKSSKTTVKLTGQ